MKKLFLWLLIVSVIAVFSLAGCKVRSVEEIVTTTKEKAVEVIKPIVKGEATIVVYLENNISDELKESIEKEIKSWEEVKEVKYISKEQAFERFKEQNKGSDILKEIGDNPLIGSFEITLKSPEKIEEKIRVTMGKIESVKDLVIMARGSKNQISCAENKAPTRRKKRI